MVVHQQINEPPAHTSFDHRSDLVILTVGQVRQSPAGVDENLLVLGLEQMCQNRESALHFLEIGLRLPPAEIGERPRGVAQY